MTNAMWVGGGRSSCKKYCGIRGFRKCALFGWSDYSQMRLSQFTTSRKASVVINISTGLHSNTRREVVCSHLLLTSQPIAPCILNNVLTHSPYPKCFSSFPEVHIKEGKQSYRTALKNARILRLLMVIHAQRAVVWRKEDKKKSKLRKDPTLL